MADGAPITGWHQPWTARHYHATGTTFGFESRAAFRIDPEDCLSAACRLNHEMAYERPDGTARVACGVEVTPDAGNYHVTARCTATWDEEIIAVREWNFSTARKLS